MPIQKNVPFIDLDKIAASGQCFRWQRLGEKSYAVPAFGKVVRLSQPSPKRIVADCTGQEWREIWSPYLDLGSDYEAYAARTDAADPYLQAALHAAWGVRILRQPLWETIVSFIISQNNNIPRIQKSLLALCGGQQQAFIEPQAVCQLSEETLRQAGLGYRAPYLAQAARRYLHDGLRDGQELGSYGEAKQYLESYKGIGPKVADCICLFALGLKDAFPMDVWVKRILSRHYGGVFPLERYRGFAGVLQQWMFFYEREREHGRL